MTKKYKPLRTPSITRGEAVGRLAEIHSLFGGHGVKLATILWRLGFRAGVKAARAQMEAEEKQP